MKNLVKQTKWLLMAIIVGASFLMGCSDKQDLAGDAPKGSHLKATKPTKIIGDTAVSYITANRTFVSDTIYILHGDVRVQAPAELTINAGTIIKGDKATKGKLFILRGAKIHATGTYNNPIIFTSAQPAGSRASQDWGGLLVIGNGLTNQTDPTVEGIPSYRTQIHYGSGTNAADNSGEIQYVRIEYGGIPDPAIANSETNGLTLCAVGSGTTINHVMVAYSGDDSFEWFGGSVNAKFLIAQAGLDDDFDTDFGFTGKVQFGIGLRDPNRADISKSNGFESDNNGTSPYSGTPKTSAVFSNFTLIGPYGPSGNTASSLYQDGLHIRRNTGISVYNSIIVGWARNGAFVDTSVHAGTLAYNTIVAPYNVTGALVYTQSGTYTPWTSGTGNVGNKATSYDNILTLSGLTELAWDLAGPDFTPDAVISGVNASTINSYFTSVSFRGATDGTISDWHFGSAWANFDTQNEPYN